jgi:hypothetical protein
MPGKLNETATVAAEWVHLCEIAVICRLTARCGSRDISPDRLPSPGCADISPATSTSPIKD